MHDHTTGIDQYPVAIGHALDMDLLESSILEALSHIFGDSPDMAVGPAGGDDHVVRKSRPAA